MLPIQFGKHLQLQRGQIDLITVRHHGDEISSTKSLQHTLYTPPKNTRHEHTHALTALFGLSRTGAPLTLASTQLAHAQTHSNTIRNFANTFDEEDGEIKPARKRFARTRGHLCVCVCGGAVLDGPDVAEAPADGRNDAC